jgi:hypothetical protein
MKNTCGYSDNWQSYKNDYDKFEYDIKLVDGTIIYNTYPNSGRFNVLYGNKEESYPESQVLEIKFSENPITDLNYEVSNVRPSDDESFVNSFSQSHSYINPYRDLDLEMGVEASLNYGLPATPKRLKDAKPVAYQEASTIGRNDMCPCGSKLKYKKCCLK